MNKNIYLCKADATLLGVPTGIRRCDCKLTKNALDLWELTFEVDRYIEVNGQLIESNFYNSINQMMKLYVDDFGYFLIDEEPAIQGEGVQEVKNVIAHSIECELSNVYLKGLKVNCGTNDSQEYLATDIEGNLNNINEYTNLPIEYISLVNYENPQLSLMHLVLQHTGWKVKDNIDKSICSIKKNFETSDSVYLFLMKTVSPALKVLFIFDRRNKEIDIVKAEDYGEDTGIFISMRNLMNSFDISSSEDKIITKFIPKGVNDIGIEYVNFGEDYIINLDYFMNELNEYGDYKFVTKEMHEKYIQWKFFRDEEVIITDKKSMTRRESYKYFTKLYNELILKESELINRVPNDGCKIDYKTFSLEELKTSLKAYNNALAALETLYKNDYNRSEIDDYIKHTPYWYDYYAYNNIIIPQVTEALKMYCETDNYGNLIYDSDGNLIELEFGNPKYYKDETIINTIDAYEYEWSLYGLNELQAKRKAWLECANFLYEDCFIIGGNDSDPIYMRPTDSCWNDLSEENRSKFTTKEAFFNKLNQYLDYIANYERENSLCGGIICKGIIRECEDAISAINCQIAAIKDSQESYDEYRKELASSVDIKNFFTSDELSTINSLMIEENYNNSNIISTNLDDIASIVDIQEELYTDAIRELYEVSQPQYSFSTEIDNLYALDEFKSYHKDFDVGNFIRVGCNVREDLINTTYVKLRLISLTYNPLEDSNSLSVEFSTMTKTLNGISDLVFLLGEQASTSSGSTSSSVSSGGTYGNNDADIQISNNMLNALLKNDTFGTTISDVILNSLKSNKGSFNTLFANSGAFDALETGFIRVSGDCLFDKIKSKNWNGTDALLDNTEGSIIDLKKGNFSFAGGNLKYDKDMLTVKGNIIADSFILSDGVIVAGLTSGNLDDCEQIVLKDNPIGKKTDEHNIGYLNISSDGILEADNAIIHGAVYATDGEFSGTVKAKSLILDSDIIISSDNLDENLVKTGVEISGENTKFKLNKDGLLELQGAIIDGGSIEIIGEKYTFKANSSNIEITNNTGDEAMNFTYEGFSATSEAGSAYTEMEISRAFGLSGTAFDPDSEDVADKGYYHYGSTIKIPYTYNFKKVSGKALYINNDGLVGLSSSSKRFKNSIHTDLKNVSDPHGLYNIDVVEYKYNDDYFSDKNDKGIGKTFIGLIAEDVAEHFADGATYDNEGIPDGWDLRYMFPAALKLIQEQHEDIKNLQKEIKELKDKITEV